MVRSAQSREEADAKATHAGLQATVFAIRPGMSMPAQDWIAEDPPFWQPKAR